MSEFSMSLSSALLLYFVLVPVQTLRASVKDEMQYHAGHGAHHVTRLHRYEHTGLESMLEQEAKWHTAMSEQQSHALRGNAMRGSSLLQLAEATEPSYSGFVQLSHVQVRALQDHHREWTSLVQTAATSSSSSRVHASHDSKADRSRGPPSSSFVETRTVSCHRHRSSRDTLVATGLSSVSSQYVGPIGVGTVLDPPGCSQENSEGESACKAVDQAKVWVVFDTGSTNIWIASDLCKEGPCRLPGRHMFNHTASSTFKDPPSGSDLSVKFGTGKITGPQAIDDFHIGPFTVHDQTFAMIETETGSVFNDVPFEGIVGMAFKHMSANGVRPFFDSIIEQKALAHNEFAFYFSKDNPSNNAIFWGGVDNTFYDGRLQYFPVVDPHYWSLKLLSLKIGNNEILGSSDKFEGSSDNRNWKGPVALVDTGTTFFTVEGNKIGDVLDKIPAAPCRDITDATHPPIVITLEDLMGEANDFALTHKEYMASSGEGDSAQCSPTFMQIDLPEEHGPGMILGEVFLRHFFAVFDRGSGEDRFAKVALGKSSAQGATATRLHELTIDQPKFAGQVA